MQHMEAVYQRVGRQDREGILFWGTDDKVLPYAISERVRALLPRFAFHAFEGGSHTVNYQMPQQVTPLLVAFLNGQA
ncbi:MAG TPA: alpha/beta hydrolase [Candidatus Hydrogenedentes bacterium]|nr:alpha/beta hydrolase [Candidatus Hydrogenedentota bacterium]